MFSGLEHVPSIDFHSTHGHMTDEVGHVICQPASCGSLVSCQVLYLKDMEWRGGEWREKCEEVKCEGELTFHLNKKKQWVGGFFGRSDVSARKLRCMSVQGMTSVLTAELNRPSLRCVWGGGGRGRGS